MAIKVTTANDNCGVAITKVVAKTIMIMTMTTETTYIIIVIDNKLHE